MEMKEIPDRVQTSSVSPCSISAQERHMASARNLSNETNPSESCYEGTSSPPEVSLHSDFPRLGIFHAPTPPVQSQHGLKSPEEETRHADLQNERIEKKFAPFGVNSLGEWYGTVPTPGSHYREYLEYVEKQPKVWASSEARHNEEEEAAATPAISKSLVKSRSSKLQCHGMKDLPGDSISSSSSSSSLARTSSAEELEVKRLSNEHRMAFLMGCQKIKEDCKAGNFPVNVANRAKYLWKILSEANDDCLCPDGTMGTHTEACCQICHKLHKISTSSDTLERLDLCMRCSGTYHMSCATKSNAIIDTPKPGDLVCRRCVPCTVHPHVEQNPLKLTEKTFGLASGSAVFKDGKRVERKPSADLLSDELSEIFRREQLDANAPGNKRIKRLREQCLKVAKELNDAHNAYLAALENNSLEIIMPDSPAQSQRRETETFLSSKKRKTGNPLV